MYAFIADTHIGVRLNRADFFQSLDIFFRHIRESEEECHAIFVCGDLFEHRLSIADSQWAAVFISMLVYNHLGKTEERLNCPVYFIHGTDSHDRDQYPIFLNMIEDMYDSDASYDDRDVFYIQHACEGKLPNGKTVLFLPQEYTDIDYEKLFSKKYDIIVGHGPISSTNKNPCKCASYETIHSADKLGEISKICVFGHYHGFTDFGNNVYYAGPWLRWKYGEDEPRVFFYCDDNWNVFTFPNPIAMEFKTIPISNPEQLRECLSQDIKSPHRFMISANRDEIETYNGIMNSCKSQWVKFIVEIKKDEDDLCLSVDEVIDAQEEAVQPMPKLMAFIKDKYNIDADDQLRQYESQINKDMEESK